MSGRFEGAITSRPEDEPLDPSIPPAPERPARPVLVELASAILIVGGITAIMGGIVALIFGSQLPANAGLPPLLLIVLNVVTIGTGVVIRTGRHWRLCLNIVGISIIVYLIAFPNPLALFYLALDTMALYGLWRCRRWFDWKPSAPSTVS